MTAGEREHRDNAPGHLMLFALIHSVFNCVNPLNCVLLSQSVDRHRRRSIWTEHIGQSDTYLMFHRFQHHRSMILRRRYFFITIAINFELDAVEK